VREREAEMWAILRLTKMETAVWVALRVKGRETGVYATLEVIEKRLDSWLP
jgi:hypothetical protein